MKIKLENILKIFYALDSISLAVYVYCLKDNLYPNWVKEFAINNFNIKLLKILKEYKIICLGIIYLACLILFSLLLLLATWASGSKYDIKEGSITEIEYANESFLPSYLGYFFVALSISNNQLFIVLFFIIFIFTYKSKLAHFNPIFLILGYKYYYYSSDGVKSLLVTKKKIKRPKELVVKKMYRLNDFTYIEI